MSLVAMPRRAVRVAWRSARGVSYRKPARLAGAISQPCTYAQIDSREYEAWCARLGLRPLRHRKTWEWVYILQVLEQHGMLERGRRGLGFGVGSEPITAYAASKQVDIVATDLPDDGPRADEWQATGQHAEQIADLDPWNLCAADVFERRVTFRPVDMRAVPDDLTAFDFTWSSCAMEHLGSLDAGAEFFIRQVDCLKPGGIGVHTTEYNVVDDEPTLADGPTVMYQRRHLEALTYEMRRRGHRMKATFALGGAPEDLHVDKKPYTDTHLRIESYDYIHTSFGLVVQRGAV